MPWVTNFTTTAAFHVKQRTGGSSENREMSAIQSEKCAIAMVSFLFLCVMTAVTIYQYINIKHSQCYRFRFCRFERSILEHQRVIGIWNENE